MKYIIQEIKNNNWLDIKEFDRLDECVIWGKENLLWNMIFRIIQRFEIELTQGDPPSLHEKLLPNMIEREL